jgi:ABC-type glycerol-3-phosphate transport system substrate-binding protein
MNRNILIAVLVIIVIIAILLGIVFLMPKGGSSGQKVVINYWGLWDTPEIYEELFKEYETNNPNIDVVYAQRRFGNDQNNSYKGEYQKSVDERLGNGEVDIVRVHQSWVPRLIPQLSAAPQSSFNDKDIKANYYPAISDAITTNRGEVYGAPMIIDGLVLFYNKDLFAKAGIQAPPTNWDDAVEVSKKLTITTNGEIQQAGINLGTASNSRHAFEIVLMMMTQANVDVVGLNAAGKVNATFNTNTQLNPQNSQKAADAVNMYFDFARKHKVWSSRLPDDLQLFNEGRLAMMIAPSWRANDIREANSKLNFEVAAVPVLPGANRDTPQYLASYWVDVVSKKSKNPSESWKLLAWLSEPAQLKRIYENQAKKRAFGAPYPRTEMASELANTPISKVVLEMAPKMKSWPLYDYGNWEVIFNSELSKLEISTGAVNAGSLQSMQDQLNQLIFK